MAAASNFRQVRKLLRRNPLSELVTDLHEREIKTESYAIPLTIRVSGSLSPCMRLWLHELNEI